MDAFSDLSQRLTAELDATVKKNEGIYFSPPAIIKEMLDQIVSVRTDYTVILEPTCGSCEVLQALDHRLLTGSLTGIELNGQIYAAIKDLPFRRPTTLVNQDYLLFQPPVKPDLICGNPPYYVLSPAKKKTVPKRYTPFYEGRANMFLIIFLKALEDIAPGGVVSFILPRNFLNCLYYNKFRRHILSEFTIHSIVDCSKTGAYLETEQDTIIFTVVHKKPTGVGDSPFAWRVHGDVVVFGPIQVIERLKALAQAGSTLARLNFNVHVGTVVWNQVKSELTDDTGETRLVYSSDITGNAFAPRTYANAEKKGYIKRPGLTEVLLVINRGYGKGEYKFHYCLLDTKGKPYLVENHLICVRFNLANDTSQAAYAQIMASFADPRTGEFIRLYFGNNIMNTTELHSIVPIFV